MLRLTIFLAVVLAASAASLSSDDLLRRLLRVFDDNKEVEKRRMHTFGYDADTETLKIGMQICVQGDKGPDCQGRAGHVTVVFNAASRRPVATKYVDYRDNGAPPTVTMKLDKVVKDQEYYVTSCEMTVKGTFEKCNGHEFTGGESVSYPNFDFDKPKEIDSWFLPQNEIIVGKKPNPVG